MDKDQKEEEKAEEEIEEEEDIIDILLPEDVQMYLTDYYQNTLFKKDAKFTYKLSPPDYDIILSSFDADGQEIFHSLNICNCKYDPESTATKKVINFEDLKNIMTNFIKLKKEREEKYKKEPNKREFASFNMHAYPMVRQNLQIDISTITFKQVKKRNDNAKEIILANYKIEKPKPDDKDIVYFCSFKLDGKKHKFGKIEQLLEQFEQKELQPFWNFYKIAYFIFCVPEEKNIISEYNLLPDWLKKANEKNVHAKFIFYIDPPGEDPNQVMNIFKMSEFEKDYYFMMNKDNLIYRADSMLCSGDIVENSIKRKQKEITLNIKQEDINNALAKFYDFVDKIKEYKYNFFFGYQLEVCLKFDKDDTKKLFVSYVHFSHLIAEVRTKEYKLLQECANIFQPDMLELVEIKTKDIEIDFSSNICKKCNKDIQNDEPMYYCYECKDKYCSKCVLDNFNNSKGLKKFIDPEHNLLYFKTRDKDQFKNIETFKLGKNSFKNCKDETKLGAHSMACNGCGQLTNYVKPRYLCLNCYPGLLRDGGFSDYCLDCIEHMNKNDEKGKQIQNEGFELYNKETRFFYEDNTKMNHDHSSHVYLMIALEFKDKDQNAYYDF